MHARCGRPHKQAAAGEVYDADAHDRPQHEGVGDRAVQRPDVHRHRVATTATTSTIATTTTGVDAALV